MGIFDKIKKGLAKTGSSFGAGLNSIFANFRRVDEDFLEELLEILIMADVGAETAEEIIDRLRNLAKLEKIESADRLRERLSDILAEMMTGENALTLTQKPSVILVVGVNGVGKTTSIGKLAAFLEANGKKVMLGAADTFRAAAADQLAIWAERAGCDIIRHAEGSDPAAVVFDSIKAGVARGADVIICDTAGRLHNKTQLMDELSKIKRVISRELPDREAEVLLVIDATTGQNAVVQARDFAKAAGVTGVILTKLDGTARGGAAVSVMRETGLPIKLIGVGEKTEDIDFFDPKVFADTLVGIERT